MDLNIKNKRALITGSTSGIGFAIAKGLADEGVEIILNGRSKQSIDTAIKKLQQYNPKAKISGIKADFRDLDSVNSLIEKINSVDILINNVGIFSSQSFENTTDEDWYNMFEVNVMSSVRLSKAFLPKMKVNNWGRIIFISSECAFLVPEDLIAYSATKAAILSISRGLAQTTKGTQVTVNSVLPGSTLTEGAKRFLKEQAEADQISEKEVANNFFKNIRTSSLLERFAEPKEIADMVVYLSGSLSAATNGAAIKVDGGSIPGII
jgi:NAD(P)-dependent dehydrogenase (short-subunit alcohol dehydrogenase family)